LRCPSPTLPCLLKIIFIENQFKRGLKKEKKNCPFFTMTMHYTFNLLGKFFFKKDSTIERGKIWIPFIKLGIRPISTLGSRRDQLVEFMGASILLLASHNFFVHSIWISKLPKNIPQYSSSSIKGSREKIHSEDISCGHD